jgi:chromosome segregation ATPase
MEMKQRKINNLEENIKYLKSHVLTLETIIKENMENLNNNMKNTDLCDTNLKNWNCTKDFEKIQHDLMQLENEKGQIEALENLFK